MYFKHYSHITIVVLLAATFSAVDVFGQTDSTANNSLKDGAWALQFQIGSSFTLGQFQGMAISGKKHIASGTAIRLGVNVSLNNTRSDDTEKMYDHDSLSLHDGGIVVDTRDDYAFEVNGQFLFYANPETEFSFLFGGGVLFRYSKGNSDYSAEPIRPPGSPYAKTASTYESTTWGVGISGLAGVEWFVSKRVSLHAEYGIKLVHESGSSAETRRNTYVGPEGYTSKSLREHEVKNWKLSPSAVLFGLSVYL